MTQNVNGGCKHHCRGHQGDTNADISSGPTVCLPEWWSSLPALPDLMRPDSPIPALRSIIEDKRLPSPLRRGHPTWTKALGVSLGFFFFFFATITSSSSSAVFHAVVSGMSLTMGQQGPNHRTAAVSQPPETRPMSRTLSHTYAHKEKHQGNFVLCTRVCVTVRGICWTSDGRKMKGRTIGLNKPWLGFGEQSVVCVTDKTHTRRCKTGILYEKL